MYRVMFQLSVVLVAAILSPSLLNAQNLNGDDINIDGGGPGGGQPDIFWDDKSTVNGKTFRLQMDMTRDYLRFIMENDAETESKRVFELNNDAPNLGVKVDRLGIGIGTTNPISPLHLVSNGTGAYSLAQMRIENFHAAVATRNMIHMKNRGPVRIAFDNVAANKRWLVSAEPNHSFGMKMLGTGKPNFNIRESGQTTIKVGGSTLLTVQPNGNVKILGTLSQSSDRNLKKDFVDVDSIEILEKVVELPIMTWAFKTDADGIRHMGPMSQDFKKSFDLGADEKTIAPIDSIGVALAAIKGLHQQNCEMKKQLSSREKQIVELSAKSDKFAKENEGLADRIDHLESVVESLVTRLNE